MNSLLQSIASPFPRQNEVLSSHLMATGFVGWLGENTALERAFLFHFLIRRK